MRLSLLGSAAWVALVLTAGCSLESNGLSDSVFDEGGTNPGETDGTSPSQGDGTVNGADGNGTPNEDATVTGEDGSQGETSTTEDGGGSDDGSSEDASKDAESDAGKDAAVDSGEDSGPHDAGHDSGVDASDASSHDSGGPDASDASDAATGIADAGPDACGSVEICNNGTDDNCDGKIDCADPECGSAQGWSCTNQQVPAGWTVVEYNANTPGSASCGTGYSVSTSVYEQTATSFPPASCGCTCTVGTSGSCESGEFSIEYAGLTSGGQCNMSGGSFPADQCNTITLGIPINGNTKESGTGVDYAAGTCSTNATSSKPTIAASGLECADPSPVGVGCANSGACVPKVSNGFSLCVAQAGAQMCPAGFTNKTHTVGSSINDTRGCTACTCTGPTAECNDPIMTIYDNGSCADAGVATLALNGACNGLVFSGGTTSDTARSFQYSATLADEACGGSGSSVPDGTVTLNGTTTICCQ